MTQQTQADGALRTITVLVNQYLDNNGNYEIDAGDLRMSTSPFSAAPWVLPK